MKTFVKGIRYDYKIFIFPRDRNNCYFSIKAVHKQTGRTSFITTVNVILSELGIDSNESMFWESDWMLSRKEANKYSKHAYELFSTKNFLSCIERYLDIDRQQSEWENYE
ncbi:MAG: hypothetical protein KJ739_04000 [Nitrospinae bacterium]|nr:hypothetical protein [Nitrospinota bacterium]